MAEKELDKVIAEHIAAVNAFDTDAIVATFAEDAFVNDARREFRGIEAIKGVGRTRDGRRQGDHRRAGGCGQLRRHHRAGRLRR